MKQSSIYSESWMQNLLSNSHEIGISRYVIEQFIASFDKWMEEKNEQAF
jgi:hypothetical protein